MKFQELKFIVIKSEYQISPADCLFEEGDLYGEGVE
jgi:hypothetical protein